METDAADKVTYAELGSRPRLALGFAVVGLAVGAVVALRLGEHPILAAWVYLAGLGVTLAYVDARTRLLPTRLIAPSYAVVVALVVVAGLVDDDQSPVIRAALGWLVMGGFYFVMWFVYPRGLGYGDVRLSGLLGLALGYVGWGALVTGMYAGFVIGAVGGVLLALLGPGGRRHFAFGPFMLVGALVGLVWGPDVAEWYRSW